MTCTPHRNVIPFVKSRRIRLAGLVARREEERYARDFGGGNLMERDHLSDVGVHGTIILKRIFKK